jgi:tRNA A37 threonylcarbamoyladenosine biosynthesis protein TsaE
MYTSKKVTPKIVINLKPGIYIFEGESGTGKSYLAKTLHRYRALKEPVDSFTYDDAVKTSLESYLNGNDFSMNDLKVVMLDRYDLYTRKFNSTIEDLAKHCIVLIDCKGPTYIHDDGDSCSIIFDEKTIEVE